MDNPMTEYRAPDEGKMYPIYLAVRDTRTGALWYLNPINIEACFARANDEQRRPPPVPS